MDNLPKTFWKGPGAPVLFSRTITNSLKWIEEVCLKGLGLTLVPEELSLFTGLQRVDLFIKRLISLPGDCGANWTESEEVNFNIGKLAQIPQNLGINGVGGKCVYRL